MDITGTVQSISPLNLFIQTISTLLLVCLAVVAVKYLIKFLKSK